MSRISEIAQRHILLTVGVAFIVGLILGLVVLGWGVWPVQWSGNARPADLDAVWQQHYLAMTADSFSVTGDAAAAQERVQALTSSKSSMAQITQELSKLAEERTAAGDADGAKRLIALAGVVGTQLPEVSPTVAAAATPGAAASAATEPLQSRFLRVLGLAVLVLVILAGLLLLVYFLQSRTVSEMPAEEPRLATAGASANVQATAVAPPAMVNESRQPVVAPQPQPRVAAPQAPVTTPAPQTAALGPFVATYNLGDIDFDMSFGIESPNGDFLGECGLGMAEVIGGGETQRVTAFEVWLFDKTDIRTVAIVLASEHAYNDAALRTKLASRGEIVLAQPGQIFSVKTSSLKLEGRVLDMAYGGGDVPSQSYFTAFSVELSPTPISSEA